MRYKSFLTLTLLLSAFISYAQEKESNDYEWQNFQEKFWKMINGKWVDLTFNTKPEIKISIFYQQSTDGTTDLFYTEESNSKERTKSTDLTDYANRIEVDIRDKEDLNDVILFHIAEKDIADKRRLELDFYFNDHFTFSQKMIGMDTAEKYIETKERYITWNDDYSQIKVLVKGTTDVIEYNIIGDREAPQLVISEYADFDFTYPVVVENKSSGDKEEHHHNETTNFKLTNSDLYGNWTDIGKGKKMKFTSYGACINCGGNFWWASEQDDQVVIEIFDLESNNAKPVATYLAKPAEKVLEMK